MPPTASLFEELLDAHTYVDKTHAITDFLHAPGHIHLLLRPRHSGKSTLLSMLKSFCELDPATREERKARFRDNNTVIAKSGYLDQDEFASHPVVHLDFSHLDAESWDTTFRAFQCVLAAESARLERIHAADFSRLSPRDTELLTALRRGAYDDVEGRLILRDLTELMHRATRRCVVLLVDGYDRPRVTAASRDDETVIRVDSFFNIAYRSLLKGNPHLHRALLAGVLRAPLGDALVSEFPAHSTLAAYADACMFTAHEVGVLCDYYREHKDGQLTPDDLERWYGGYQCAKSCGGLFAPRSVLRALESGELRGYCDPDTAIRSLLVPAGDASAPFQREIGLLASRARRRLRVEFDDSLLRTTYPAHAHPVIFGIPVRHRDGPRTVHHHHAALFGALLHAGYLTADPSAVTMLASQQGMATVWVPNLEMEGVWRGWVEEEACRCFLGLSLQ